MQIYKIKSNQVKSYFILNINYHFYNQTINNNQIK